MEIFLKGDYRPIPPDYRTLGLLSLAELTKFQEKFDQFDTDTTVNSIRDSIVANYLGFDLLNFGKHGFDAKKSTVEQFLEIKQCSITAGRLGGTWNDTNPEKAQAFSDPRLFTVVAIWKGASDLQFMVYGQHPSLGNYLLRRVNERKAGSRSTQNIPIEQLLSLYGFSVIAPPDKTPESVLTLLISYKGSLAKYVHLQNIQTVEALQ
jgi:hypothetical protein